MKTIFLSPFMQPSTLGEFKLDNDGLHFLQEIQSTSEEVIKRLCGTYASLDGKLIALFTIGNENFLSLDGRVFPFDNTLSIEYLCAEDYEKSFISIKMFDRTIFEVTYVNPHEPLSLDFPDWSFTNFAFHVDRYLREVKSSPAKALFETLN